MENNSSLISMCHLLHTAALPQPAGTYSHTHVATGISYIPGLSPGHTKQKTRNDHWYGVYCLIYRFYSTCKCLSNLFSVLTTAMISWQCQKLSTTNIPGKQVKSKSFPAENSQILNHSHTGKEKTDFPALCWTVEVLHTSSRCKKLWLLQSPQ